MILVPFGFRTGEKSQAKAVSERFANYHWLHYLWVARLNRASFAVHCATDPSSEPELQPRPRPLPCLRRPRPPKAAALKARGGLFFLPLC